MNNRGVSDVIGFTLIFGLIILSVSLVSLTAFGSIQDSQDREEYSNAERAFDVLGQNTQEVVNGKASSRSTEISLGDGQLYVDDSVTYRIQDGGTTVESSNVEPIVYRSNSGDELVYTVTALNRNIQNGGATFGIDPVAHSNNDVGYVSIPSVSKRTQTSSGLSGGTRDITYSAQNPNRAEYTTTDNIDDLELVIEDTKAPFAWERYCDSSEMYSNVNVTASGDVTCEFDSGQLDELIINHPNLTVEIR